MTYLFLIVLGVIYLITGLLELGITGSDMMSTTGMGIGMILAGLIIKVLKK